MDAAGLQGLFSQSNPFLAQMGEQAWNLDQQKAQQGLQAALGQEQRAQVMQPLDMAHKQATTGYNQALTQQLTDKRAGDLPANEKMTLAMSEYRKKMSDAQAAEEDTKMQRRMQYAEMAVKNGGVLPLEYLNQLDEGERGHFANPKAVATTRQLAQSWYDTHPKTIEAKRKQEADLEKARIMAGPGYARAAASGSPKPVVLKTIDSKLIALSDEYDKATTEEDKAAIQGKMAFWQQQKAKAAQDVALARGAGSPDLSGRLPTQTGEPTAPIPYPGKEAPTAPKPKPLTYKTPDDVKAAFKSGKLTKEQAIQLLQKEHGMQ